jgi:uncharacterized membrane protein (UPF0136 family)
LNGFVGAVAKRGRGMSHPILGLDDEANSGSLRVVHNLANTVLWIYIVLLLAGGLIGFLKAGSKVSLITAAVSAALLVLTAVPGFLDAAFARKLATLIMAALLVVFAVRLGKTKKFMPSGWMLVITIVALALRNIWF